MHTRQRFAAYSASALKIRLSLSEVDRSASEGAFLKNPSASVQWPQNDIFVEVVNEVADEEVLVLLA
jgi:hypothetical protein